MIGKNQRAQGASQTLADGPVNKRQVQKNLPKNASSSENSKIAPLPGDKAALKTMNASQNGSVKALPLPGDGKKAAKEEREFGRQLSMNNWEADGKTLVL